MDQHQHYQRPLVAFLRTEFFWVMIWAIHSASAATLYVDTTNAAASDLNEGSEGSPWKTISHATTNASAGDTVIVKPGEYAEYLTLGNSGTNGSPIVFTGVRGEDGSWLTILDPSTPLTNGWVDASGDIGAGVWKKTNMTFVVSEMTLNQQRLGFVYTPNDMASAIGNAYLSPPASTGAGLMSLASDQVVTNVYSRTNGFWDGIEALYCSTGSVCYLRFRDSSEPNGLDLRGANTDTLLSGVGVSNITWQNFLMRGAYRDILLNHTNTHHITITSNYLSGGASKIYFYSNVHDCVVSYNTLTADFYGTTNIGAWESDSYRSNFTTQVQVYALSKFFMNPSSVSLDDPIYLYKCGDSNVITGNTVYRSMGDGIEIWGSTDHIPNWTEISSNIVDQAPDAGIRLGEFNLNTRVFRNTVKNCNDNLRPHHFDTTGDSRLQFVYRNLCWLPAHGGHQIYFHYNNSTPDTYFPTVWFYQNSFSGGDYMLSPSGSCAPSGGLTNVHFLNNIFSGGQYISGYAGIDFITNAYMVATFDYNIVTPPWMTYPTSAAPAWREENNLTNAVAIWSIDSFPNFRLNADSIAVDAGVDIPTVYPSLPEDGTIKYGAEWDIGALEFRPPTTTASNINFNTLILR